MLDRKNIFYILGGVVVFLFLLLLLSGSNKLRSNYKSQYQGALSKATSWSSDAKIYHIEALTTRDGALKKDQNTYFKSYFYSESKDKTYVVTNNGSGSVTAEEQPTLYTIFGYPKRAADIFASWNLLTDSTDWAKKCAEVDENKTAVKLNMTVKPDSLSAKDPGKMNLVCNSETGTTLKILTIWE